MITWVEEHVSAKGLSFVGDLGWVATGSSVNQVITTLEWCAANSVEWECWQGLQIDTAKTEAVLFTCRRGHKKHHWPKLTVKIKVGNWFIQFNNQATRWLGITMDAHLTFKEHHNRCMKIPRAAQVRLQTLTNNYRILLESIRAIRVAFIQAVTLYGSELWCDSNEVGRRDNLHCLLNRRARSVLGALPSTPRGALMRQSGLTAAPEILDCRQQRFTARLGNAWSSKLKKLLKDPSYGTLIF